MHRAVFRMLVTAWLLGIANPQSIKRLGHFLTADCKSAGTPNGGKAYPALRRDGHIRRYGTPNGGQDISGVTGNISAGTPNGGQAYPALWMLWKP